ncbi:hypothetical protein ACN95_04435 [Gordonia sihwensis]|nr:hypothetical protein [Gordonia sihwensis]
MDVSTVNKEGGAVAAPAWRSLRRGTSGGVASLVELGERHGLDPADCLQGSGLRHSDLRVDGAVVLAEQELAVIANIVSLLNDPPGLGIEAGRMVNLGNLGIFVFAMLSSETLGDAVEVATRFASLTNTYSDLSVTYDESGSDVRLECSFGDVNDDVRPFILERDLTVIAGLVPMVLGDVVMPRVEAEVDRARGALLASVLPTEELVCDAGRTALVVPREWMSRGLPHADAETARRCIAQCEQQLEQRRLGARSLVWARLHGSDEPVQSLTRMAGELHVDRRTLQRRLAREGTTFRALLEESRRIRAAEALTDTDRPVAEIAAGLGYAETAAFTRAFTRWYGVTPTRYRARNA